MSNRKEADPLDDPWQPSRTVRKVLGDVSDMTIHRWVKNGTLHKPEKINGRNYWRRSWVRVHGGGAA